MQSTLPQRISARITELTGQYHQLLLVVGPRRTGKTAALVELRQHRGWPLVNLNLTLARRMIDLTMRQRRLRASALVEDIVAEQGSEIVLVDNTELLFQPDLTLDPLSLLRTLARTRTVVATWRGQFRNDALTHADRGHPEYKSYERPSATIVMWDAPGPEEPSAGSDREPPS